MISTLYRNKAHLHYSQFSCSWFCVFGQHHTAALPSAVLWHLCMAISLLNSCLIIPNRREYSNEAFNAFFHMILQSWDSCSAAFNAMFRKGTDFSTQLIIPVKKKKLHGFGLASRKKKKRFKNSSSRC